MKKILPYILITLILANLFAPFSLGINENKGVSIQNNLVYADDTFQGKLDTYKQKTSYALEVRIGYLELFKDDPFEKKEETKTARQDFEAAAREVGIAEDDAAKSATTDAEKDELKKEKEKYILGLNSEIPDPMPSCKIIPPRLLGCVAQIIYYVVFVPTSYIFALAGKFMDFTFFYSVSDDSYRSPFVIEGWGIVRDFVNLFFIFVLLYIAFATILSLHGFKTKEMIINVVIIGLLINFSLFATQVIIDTSNILARVFYNSINVTVTEKKAGNTTITTKGAEGEVQLSTKIVEKVDPQKLILQSEKVGQITDKGGLASGSKLSSGQFILITLLAIAVNIVGFFIFLSIGLIFVARVIGLWLAMVFVPFAFFSYTVPAMQGIDMIGWKKWWPETLKLAFLAPIFIFFLYIIIKFLDKTSFIPDHGQTGMAFIISVVVPFAIIMVLLKTAKRLAVKFSGDIGSAVTTAGTAIGGVALGGAALSAAFVGRNTLGSVSKYAQNDTARQKDSFANYKNWSLGKKLNPFSYGKAVSAGTAKQLFKVPGGKDAAGNIISLGKKMQVADAGFGEKLHSTQILDDKMQSEFGHLYDKDKKFKNLTEPEQRVVKQEVDKDEIAKFEYGKKFKDLGTQEAGLIQTAYNRGARPITDSTGKTNRVDNPTTLNTPDPITGAPRTGEKIKSDSIVDFSKVNAPIGEFVQALRKGSMDIRNLSETKAKSKGLIPGLGIGLLATIAAGTRMGLKNANINHGTGQADFFKDLKNTLSESLKNIKIKVDAGGSGKEEHKEAKSVGH